MSEKDLSLWVALLIVLASFTILFSAGTVEAHSPTITTDYDKQNEVLTVDFSHSVSDPQSHYIENVVVEVDGSTVIDRDYTEQPDDTSFQYTYDVTATSGETIETTAYCSNFGSDSDTYVVEGEFVEYDLTINIDGEGSTSPTEGTHTYEEGDVVTVEATPAVGWEFDMWTGDENSTDSTMDVTMDANKSITANFEESTTTYNLTVNIDGEGTVEANGMEVMDGWTKEYQSGMDVNLEAMPIEDWVFTQWMGDVTESDRTITVTMDANKSVTAIFEESSMVETYNLTINIEGEGSVEVDEQEVEDGWTKEYEEGTEITLQAIPLEGWELVEWTGTNKTGDTITITMDQDKEITARFEEREEGGIPGFTTVILLVAVIAALVVYHKKR